MAPFPQSVDEDSPDAIALRDRGPLKFFMLVFALSVPFWLIGVASGIQILPGLPVSSLGAFCPLMAASILVYSREQDRGRNRAAEEGFRLQANQSEGLVCAHRSSDAWRDGLDVWPDALDGGAASNPATLGSGGAADVTYVLYRRSW
jgi:hypothetical protein